MKSKTFKLSMLAVILLATGLMSFVILSKSYFAVCGQCGWVSPATTTYGDASSMGADHYRAKSDHKSNNISVGILDTEITSTYAAVCGQCNWQSPTVSNYGDASSIGADHYRAQTDHRSNNITVMKKSN